MKPYWEEDAVAVLCSGMALSWPDARIVYDRLKAAGVLCEEVFSQSRETAAFNETSANTMRLVTLVCADGTVRVMGGAIRIGRKGECADSLNILERRPGCVFQCPFASILQPFRSVLVCQLQQTHAGLVALLLYFVAAENGLDSDLRVAADFTGPVNEPFTIPLDILLVLWRHMLLDRAVLVKPAVQPGMGTDSVPAVENLYRGSGEPDIYFLLDVLKGNRIVHALHGNVVIWSHRCHFPGGQFKRSGRQRAQEGPFFCKAAGPAAFPLLERFMVERLQTVPNRLVQFQ